MQELWIARIPQESTSITKNKLLSLLPASLSARALRYLNTDSCLGYLMGRLLLKKAIIKNGLSLSLLENIQYSKQGKPNLQELYFSISHSDGYVAFISSTTCDVGIDIEKKKHIDLKLFRYLFTETEWNSICNSENVLERFYWFWVRKEALLKIAGCALKDLKILHVFQSYGTYMGKDYYFEPFGFDNDFNGIIATEEKVDFDMKLIDIKDVLLP